MRIRYQDYYEEFAEHEGEIYAHLDAVASILKSCVQEEVDALRTENERLRRELKKRRNKWKRKENQSSTKG